MNTQLSLVVLAAGMWSRYGWLKQIDEFGPGGQSLLEYAVYDAVRAGFEHIVLVIREEFQTAFEQKFEKMLDTVQSFSFVFQTIDKWREKPRGTLHATLCAREVVTWPFAVVNADDRYGTWSYALLAQKLTSIQSNQAYLVGYTLRNTLSEYGTVNRGVCTTHVWLLSDVTERYAIGYDAEKIVDREGNVFTWDETVSMNFWWFHQDFFAQAMPLFQDFQHNHPADPKAEMVIPDAVDQLIHDGVLECEVVQSQDPWQWVTNPEDKPRVSDAFDQMHDEWVYPWNLW